MGTQIVVERHRQGKSSAAAPPAHRRNELGGWNDLEAAAREAQMRPERSHPVRRYEFSSGVAIAIGKRVIHESQRKLLARQTTGVTQHDGRRHTHQPGDRMAPLPRSSGLADHETDGATWICAEVRVSPARSCVGASSRCVRSHPAGPRPASDLYMPPSRRHMNPGTVSSARHTAGGALSTASPPPTYATWATIEPTAKRASVRAPASRLVTSAARLIAEQQRLWGQHRLERCVKRHGVPGSQPARHQHRRDPGCQVRPAAVPAGHLGVPAGGRRGRGRSHLGFRRKIDPGAVQHPPHVLLTILGVRERLPWRAEQQAPRESHTGAQQSTRQAEVMPAQWPHDVEEGERRPAQRRRVGRIRIGDEVRGLNRVGAGTEPSCQRRQQVRRDLAVRVDHAHCLRPCHPRAGARTPSPARIPCPMRTGRDAPRPRRRRSAPTAAV